MRLFGLTGGVGMGKSTCADLLAKAGLSVVDTDQLAHELTRPGMPALGEIVSAFGPSLLDPSGCLHRRRLGQIVFADTSARRRLETILHPRIKAAWTAEVEGWRAVQAAAGVVVIPLLFETQAESHFDATLCVACSRLTQASRLGARGWTPEEVIQRIAAQMPVEQKMERSDYVIWNEGSVESLDEQLRRILSTRN